VNEGLLGLPGPQNDIGATYASGATGTYTIGTEPTQDIPVLDDYGRPLQVRFNTVVQRMALVRFFARFTKNDSNFQIIASIYDGAASVAPRVVLELGPGKFSSFFVGESTFQQVFFDYPVMLPPGPHVIEVWHHASGGTSNTIFGDRVLEVEVLG
jgi:hypothetical protein